MSTRWYVASTGDHQGLVIDEATGRNVAVAYDKADAPLIAEAPAMLDCLTRWLDIMGPSNPNLAGQTRAIIASAKVAA